MKRTITFAGLAALAGCAVNPIGEPAKIRAEWALHADADLALQDPRCTGTECPRYPNPHACEALEVRVLANGRVCGTCVRDGVREGECGGPARGIPYRCFLERGSAVDGSAAKACIACDDSHGTPVLRDCGGETARAGYALAGERDDGSDWGEPPPVPEDGGEHVCYDAFRADGSACHICVDAARAISSDGCTTSPPPAPPDDGMDSPPPDAPDPPDDGGSSCPSRGFEHGQRLFAAALDRILSEAGLAVDYAPGAHTDPEIVEDAREDAARVRAGTLCEDGLEEARDERDDEGWLREGRPRCGYMVTIALGRACRDASAGCAAVEGGLIGEQEYAAEWLDDRFDCVLSPVVLDLDGDGARSARTGAHFDLAAIGRARPTAWVEPGDALLAIDHDGDGAITDGRELFGELAEGVGGGAAGDGFAALSRFDGDGDGDVDASDPEFGALLAWRDDGDGRSEPGELASLSAVGVRRIELRATRVGALDDAGSVLALWGRFERDDGSFGVACDVFFAAGRE